MGNLKKILQSKNISFYQQDRFSLDNYEFSDTSESLVQFDKTMIFETNHYERVKRINLPDHPISNFRFFLDGSRKTYKIGDVVTNNRKFMPVVAGQVCAGCCFRDDFGRIKKHFPPIIEFDLLLSSAINEDDFYEIKEKVENENKSGIHITVSKYDFAKFDDITPTNAAIAVIHKRMRDLEIEILKKMVMSQNLNTESMLVIDGSLQFLSQKYSPEIFYNVIGLSKSYDPNLTGMVKGNVHIGSVLADLKFGERTPVFKSTDGRNTFGVWYLCIRERHNVKDPLEGIVKVEKMAMKENEENGFDSNAIDNISTYVLSERIPTCHGNDDRWANHIYPIYLTEKFLKSNYLSDVYFMNIF
jgi:hypothetical protein